MSAIASESPSLIAPAPEAAVGARATPGAPPWLWLWAVLFVVNLPDLLDQWRVSFDQLSLLRASTAQIRAVLRQTGSGADYGRLDFLLYPAVLLDFLPSAALLLGLVAVLVPRLRAWYVRRRFGLGPLPREMSRVGVVIAEIEAFVQGHAPRLRLTGNLGRFDLLAFVYPEDYRRSSLAIFGPLVQLWATDRVTAEAVLLHEMAHHRRGDARIVGVGSAFEGVVRLAVPTFVVLFLVPTAIVHVDNALRANEEFADLGMPSGNVWDYQLGLAQVQAVKLLAILGGYLLWFASFLVAPLAAIWSAEFTADRFAADSQGGPDGMRKALGGRFERRSWWRWLLSRLSHPPVGLRRWMLGRRLPGALGWLVLVFPLAYVVRLLCLNGWAAFAYAVIDVPAAEIWDNTIDNSLWYVGTMPRVLLPMAVGLVLWPFVVRRWEAAMTGEGGGGRRAGVGPYWIAGGLVLALGVLGLILRWTMDDGGSAGPRTL